MIEKAINNIQAVGNSKDKFFNNFSKLIVRVEMAREKYGAKSEKRTIKTE